MEDYEPDLIPTPEFTILHTLATDPDASEPHAVHESLNLTIVELPPKYDLSRDQPERNVAWNIGVLTIDIAAKTAPVQQTKLLDFISRLQKVIVTYPRTGEMVKYRNFEYLWTDLSSFEMHAADKYNFHTETYLSAVLWIN